MRYAWSSMSSVMAAPCNQSVFGPRNMLLMVIYVLQGQFSPKAICGFFVIDSWLHLFWGNTWTPHILLCPAWPSKLISHLTFTRTLSFEEKKGSKCWFLIYCMFKMRWQPLCDMLCTKWIVHLCVIFNCSYVQHLSVRRDEHVWFYQNAVLPSGRIAWLLQW